MKNDYSYCCKNNSAIQEILKGFEKKFIECLNDVKPQSRRLIIQSLPHIFRQWYYSSLIAGSPLTPANFVNVHVKRQLGDDHMLLPLPSPVICDTTVTSLNFNYVVFSIAEHPILYDLEYLLEKCFPAVEIDSNGEITGALRDELIQDMTFKESNYLLFLTNIAFNLELLVKMPSIKVIQAQPSYENLEVFFHSDLSSSEKLNRIIESVADTASNVLNVNSAGKNSFFSSFNILNSLRNSTDVDVIFQKYFGSLDIDLTEELDRFTHEKDLNNMDENSFSLLSSFFSLSSLFDMLVLTPFGFYMQLLQPMYYDKYDFELKLEEIQMTEENDSIPLQFFYFLSAGEYDLTSLGKSLFASTNQQNGKLGISIEGTNGK